MKFFIFLLTLPFSTLAQKIESIKTDTIFANSSKYLTCELKMSNSSASDPASRGQRWDHPCDRRCAHGLQCGGPYRCQLLVPCGQPTSQVGFRKPGGGGGYPAAYLRQVPQSRQCLGRDEPPQRSRTGGQTPPGSASSQSQPLPAGIPGRGGGSGALHRLQQVHLQPVRPPVAVWRATARGGMKRAFRRRVSCGWRYGG